MRQRRQEKKKPPVLLLQTQTCAHWDHKIQVPIEVLGVAEFYVGYCSSLRLR